jgi:hypothetical protein
MNSTQHSADDILAILDQSAGACSFPMLDNGYVYPAATRLSLFRSDLDWAMVIELFGYSPRAGQPDLFVGTYASRLHERDKPDGYVSEVAYQNYLVNNPNNEARFFQPVQNDTWIDTDGYQYVTSSGEALLRDIIVPLPSANEYHKCGIGVAESRPAIHEFCRYMATNWREKVLATVSERRVSVLPELQQILQLEDWHHPDLAPSELPSDTQCFQQLASVLATGDVSHYRPTEPPNTHWIHWPDAGTL